MSDVDDHTLNACLARVVGLRWGYAPDLNEHGYFDRDGHLRYTAHNWEPVTDPVQMEEVEAAISKEHKIEYVWTGEYWYVVLDRWCLVSHRDKKRAFALAVQAMEQSNNNNNKED